MLQTMSAHPQTVEILRAPSHDLPPRAQFRWMAVAALATVVVLNGLGLLLSARRLLGALTIDLPMGQLFATALVSTIAAKVARRAWRAAQGRPHSPRERRLDVIVGWGTSLGLMLMAVGCCYPGLRNGEWLTWLPMLIADQFWRQNFFDNGHPGLALADLPEDETFPDNFLETAVAAAEPQLAEEPQPAEQMVQQLFRVRDAEGYEVIYGTVRADFLAGQRHAVVHVGFCPPLPAKPNVEADACQWPDARVLVAQALPHGVRLEVKLREPAEEACYVPIDMAASPMAG